MASTIRIRVRADDDTDGFRGIRASVRSLGRSLISQMASVGSRAGSALSGALTSSVGSVFSAAGSNPFVAAGIAALAAAAASAVGAALAGAITLAFGGAFVGLGLVLAAQNEKVRKDWGRTLGRIKADFAEAAKPLLPVLDAARRRLESLASKFAPHFEKAMEAAAPYLTDFLDHIGDGIEKFGKIAFKPMMDAFNELLEALGPHVEGFLESLGESFRYLAGVVSDNKDEIALLFRILLEAIPVAIRIVGGLAAMWGYLVRNIESAVDWLQDAWGWVNRAWDRVVSFSTAGVGEVIASVAGAWGWVNRAWSRTVKFFSSGVPGVVGLVSGLWGWVNRSWRRIVPFGQTGIPGVVAWVSRLWRWVARNWRRTVRFFSGGIPGVIRAISRLWGWVSRTWSRTVSFRFNVSGPVDMIRNLVGKAHGGVVGAMGGIATAATGGVRANQVLVGEQGPEIVDLPSGSRVRSNPDTRRLLGGSGGGSRAVQLTVNIDGRTIVQEIFDPLKKEIRNRGGIQAALGS